MRIEFRDGPREFRFFDRFDAAARDFEDGLRGRMDAGSVPWPRLSFRQSYRHLESVGERYFVLQLRGAGERCYQLAAVQRTSKLPLFKTAEISHWIPAPEPERAADQEALLRKMAELCRARTALMSLRAHAYVPGDAALDAAQALLRRAGYADCARESAARTRIVDLRGPLEDVLAEFSSKTRTKLRIKKPDEVCVEALTSRAQIPALEAALSDAFRRSAEQECRYDFASLFATMELHPETVAALGFFLDGNPDAPEAFAVAVGEPPLFEYALAGSRSSARLRQFPFNLILLWRLIETAKARGAELFDLGGITEGGPGDPLAGISDFKRHFPGFETSIGCEGLAVLRPARCRAYAALKAAKSFVRK